MARNILVVEDDEGTRVGLLVLLAEAGYRTIGASTLKQATELLTQENPDLVIVDVRLGGDNGLQLIAMAARPVPAIVTTAFADPTLATEARQLGAEFMVKPLSPPELLQVIERKLAEAALASSGTSRRWPRKQISTVVSALVGDAPARIVDVGYGGVRFELESGWDASLPETFHLTVPGNISVPVNVVWNRRRGDIWQYGVAVNDEFRSAWRQLVDTLS